ncbi:MAG TPA: methyltransferase domain-containing protein [Burkholderiales bacterium]|nr:methyltransferase domain-containing protein [Burkholderiales bacterium]
MLQNSMLADWFETPKGTYVLGWERKQFDAAVEDVFGYNAVQVGLPGLDFLRESRIPLRVRAGAEPGCSLRSDPVQLPLASQSIDLLALPHVLEFCARPHAILREAERVLMPEGSVVISGFNPLSLWGAARALGWERRRYPGCGRYIGLLRLKDWLALLGFELNGGRFGCYAPPFTQGRWLQRFGFMEKAGERWWPICGGVYVVRAVKRVAGMRLVTPNWRSVRAPKKALAPVAQRGNGLHVEKRERR